MADDVNSNEPKIVSEHAFAVALQRERKNGFGIVPLAGAGLSAPSGVPLINELHQYLQKCIALALGVNRYHAEVSTLPQFHREWRWHPQRDEWPTIQSAQSYRLDEQNWQRQVGHFARRMSYDTESGVLSWDDYPETEVFLEAYGACAEWRSSLHFLARLDERIEDQQRMLRLGPVDPDVIDNFFLNVVLGKAPTLGHQMLARLAGPLGINTVLTLNFEDLIEKAFADVGNILTVYGVHSNAGLPSYHSHFGKNVLVKMHGDRYGLRADYSLDAMPDENDRRHFLSYLSGQFISRGEFADMSGEDSMHMQNKSGTQNHLLVIGVSGKEDRILNLIKAGQEKLSGFKVFWISYTRTEAIKAWKILRNVFSDTRRFCVVQHHFPGLLFFNLYQTLTGAIPPDGSIFPSESRLSVPPMPYFGKLAINDKKQSKIDSYVSKCNSAIESFRRSPARKRIPKDRLDKLVLLHGGVKSSLSTIHVGSCSFQDQLDHGCQAVWIDLSGVLDANELFEVLLATIARKAGVVDWFPVLAQVQADVADSTSLPPKEILMLRAQEIAHLTNNPMRDWVVFLNTCGGGAGSNLNDIKEGEEPNGWVGKKHPSKPGGTDCCEAFLDLLNCLCSDDCPNITVVMVCEDHESDDSLVNTIQKRSCLNPKNDIEILLKSDLLEGKDAMQRAEDWIAAGDLSQREDREHFLHALVSVNQTRSKGMLYTRVFHPRCGKSKRRMRRTNGYLKSLEREGLIQRQVGGFWWMCNDVRSKLRARCRGSLTSISPERKAECLRRSIQIHHGLGEWYVRLHMSSKSARAATESVYHHLIQVRRVFELNSLDEEAEIGNVIHRVFQGLGSSLRILRQARPSILTDGYSQGTCRRLIKLREDCDQLGRELKCFFDAKEEYEDKWLEGLKGISPTLCHEGVKRVLSTHEGWEEIAKVEYALYQLHKLTLALNMDIAQEIGYLSRAEDRWKELWDENPESSSCYSSDYKECIPRAEIHRKNRLATMGIARRSDKTADKHTGEIFEEFKFPFYGYWNGANEKSISFTEGATIGTKEDKNKFYDLIRNKSRQWLEEAAANEGDAYGRENVKLQLAEGLMKTLQRRIQMDACKVSYLRVMKVRYLIDGQSDQIDECEEQIKHALEEADHCSEIAIELNRAVQRDSMRYARRGSTRMVVRDQITQWYDDQQRLKTQQAMCLAFKEDFIKAHRRLNEAEAALVELRYPDGLEKGIIELHRADLLFCQAVNVDWKKSGGRSLRNDLLKAFYDKIKEGRPVFPNISEDLIDIIRRRKQKEEDIQKSLSFIKDSWQTLDRAEPILKRFRKNAWWTTWYFELRMKLIEFQLFASLGLEGGSSLPYVGTQATPYNFPTVVDKLLDNSRRIIRGDIYRLSRIVEAYSNCLLVLGLWRYRELSKGIDHCRSLENEGICTILKANELQDRERNMLKWLTNSEPCAGEKTLVRGPLLGLEILLNQRNELDKGRGGGGLGDMQLSEHVRKYAEFVIEHGFHIKMFSDGNLRETSLLWGRLKPFVFNGERESNNGPMP